MKTLKNVLAAVLFAAMITACSSYESDEDRSTQSEQFVSEKESYDLRDESTEEAFNSPTSVVESREMNKKSNTTGNLQQNVDYALIVSSTAASDVNIDEHRMIVRKADMKFRVKNVAQSTYAIEQITVRQGGWVAQTNLWSEPLSEHKIRISEDSSLVITRYVVKNTIILRVPYTALDTTLRSFVPLIDYLDYRIIQAEDVTLQQLAEQLKQKRLADYNQRMRRHADTKTSRLMDVTEAERQILLQQERADAAYIEELKLYDNIKYSTISIDIYETEKFEQMMVSNPDEIKSYRPGFWKRFVQSVSAGWIIIQEIVLFIIRLWGLIVVAIGIFFLVKFLKKRFRSKKSDREKPAI